MYSKTLTGDIDQNLFQPNSIRNKHSAHQGKSVAKNETILKGEAETKPQLSKYTDD